MVQYATSQKEIMTTVIWGFAKQAIQVVNTNMNIQTDEF